MSSILTIRKNGVDLVSFSRSNYIYQVLSKNAVYNKWTKINPICFCYGREELNNLITGDFQTELEIMQDSLPYIKDPDQVISTMRSIKEYEEYIKEIEKAIVIIDFLQEICTTDIYVLDENEEEQKYSIVEPYCEWCLE